MSRQEGPSLFEAITQNEAIDAPDARRDRRTAALHGSLMAPFGTTGLYAVPITQAGRATGLVMLEDGRRDPDARDFAQACATLVGLATQKTVSTTDVPSGGAAAPAVLTRLTQATETVGDDRGLDPALAAYASADISQPRAAVLVLNLPATDASLAHRIACSAQEITAAHAIPYVKMLGTRIVVAAGFAIHSGDGQAGDRQAAHGLRDAASRLADVAIALREGCAGLLDAGDGLAAFGLGLDVGPIISAKLGEAPGLFNLWGEAVQGADALAASAAAETIQVSEQAYVFLQQAFIFRPRGLFYRPTTGKSRSYVLAGRA